MFLHLIIGIILYMAAMLAIGFYSSKKIHNMADYLVAGRRLPFTLATGTLFATWFGAGAFMGASGTVYQKGIMGVISDPFAAGLSLIVAGYFYAAKLRHLKLITITDVYKKYYSHGSELFASFFLVFPYIAWLAAQMVALGFLFNQFIGLPTELGIILGATIVLIYTYEGGMWAVTLTDFIQMFFILIGIYTLYPIVMQKAGGIQNIIAQTPPEFLQFMPSGDLTAWIPYLGLIVMGLSNVVGQDLIQRSLSSRDERVAKNSAIASGILYLFVGVSVLILGLAGRILFPQIDNPENIIPHMASQYLSAPLLIIFIGAVISIIMSTASSALLAGVSLTTHNILKPLYPKMHDQDVLKASKICTIIFTLMALVIALYLKQVYVLMVNSWAILVVAIWVPVTMALYYKKANREAAWAAMIVGMLTWIIYLIQKQFTENAFSEASLYGGLASLTAYLLVTWYFRKPVKNLLDHLKNVF